MTSPLRPSIRIFTLSRQPILNASFSTSKSFFNGNKCGSENLKSDSSFDPKKSIQDQGKKAMDVSLLHSWFIQKNRVEGIEMLSSRPFYTECPF